MRKLDVTKSFGTVSGNPGVLWCQDGVDFDAYGNEVKPKPDKAPIVSPTTAEAFLQDLLSKGKAKVKVINKEAEDRGLVWQDVLEASRKLEVVVEGSKEFTFWKLRAN